MSLSTHRLVSTSLLASLLPALAVAQGGITQPPSGANQKASVIQHIGLVEVRIDYSSPDVTGPSGDDRRGKIWGQLVPWGMANLGFGTAEESPWRAGANENTVFTVSHDVLIEGKPLAAGSYGLHMSPQPDEWTIIFSNNHTSWGSFFYDPAEDALRVVVEPEEAEFREWLSYDFIDRQPDRATVALHWEELRVPFTLEVPDTNQLYVAKIRDELRSTAGFSWQGFNAAANFCLRSDINLEEALTWAEAAINRPFVGQKNFTTLQTKALLLTRLSRDDEADPILAELLETGSENEINALGYGFLQQLQNPERAIEIFRKNVADHPDSWNVHDSLGEAYAAKGETDLAIASYEKALSVAPEQQRSRIEGILARLRNG